MDPDSHQEIERLKAQVEQIRAQFHMLLSQEDPSSIRYVKEIEKATEDRFSDLESYKENEEKATKMLYDGMIYQIDDDNEQAKLIISERLQDFIRFKFDTISENFPNARSYFKGKSCKFLDMIYQKKTYDPEECEGYKVELSTNPLAVKSDVATKIEEYNDCPKNYYVKDTTLHCGNKAFGIGANVIVCYKINKNFATKFPCTINEINNRYIEVTTKTSKVKRIKIEALKYKICTLKRVYFFLIKCYVIFQFLYNKIHQI